MLKDEKKEKRMLDALEHGIEYLSIIQSMEEKGSSVICEKDNDEMSTEIYKHCRSLGMREFKLERVSDIAEEFFCLTEEKYRLKNDKLTYDEIKALISQAVAETDPRDLYKKAKVAEQARQVAEQEAARDREARQVAERGAAQDREARQAAEQARQVAEQSAARDGEAKQAVERELTTLKQQTFFRRNDVAAEANESTKQPDSKKRRKEF